MKRGKRGRGRKSSPKLSLNLPDLDQAKSAVLNSLPSKESQRGYRHAIGEFIAWYCSELRLSFNKAVVTRYRIYLESRQLAPGTINGRLAAVRRLAYEAADSGLLSPDLAAGIRRVKGPKNLEQRPISLALERVRVRHLAERPCLIGGILLGCGRAGKRRPSLRSPIFSAATIIGPSLTWSARPAIFGRCQFRTGSRAPSIPGLYPLA